MSDHSRIRHAFENAPVFPLNARTRYVLFSDCHRGDGSSNDNFLKNQNLYFTALRHYFDRGYIYVELGDGDELWENRKMSQIIELHSNVFWLLSLFHRQNRLYLTHGHQADALNSTFWKLARFLVRYLWRPLEHFGVLDPTSAAKNYVCKDRVEQRLSSYASEHQMPLITGHTHRPRLHAASPYYMNTGSCVHPRCITCMELENNQLSLVKWALSVRRDQTLFVERTVLSTLRLDKETFSQDGSEIGQT